MAKKLKGLRVAVLAAEAREQPKEARHWLRWLAGGLAVATFGYKLSSVYP